MLAFDIETTGLDPIKCVVTIVSTEDYKTGETKHYEFSRMRKEAPDRLEGLKSELINDFDAASSLCAFNGIQFDIPFMMVSLKLPADVVTGWVLKTTDILECSRHVHGNTFGLNLLCGANGIQLKSSSGLEAIKMANEGRWEDLREYCQDDVHILCALYRKRFLKNPRTQVIMDLREWSDLAVYYNEMKQGCRFDRCGVCDNFHISCTCEWACVCKDCENLRSIDMHAKVSIYKCGTKLLPQKRKTESLDEDGGGVDCVLDCDVGGELETAIVDKFDANCLLEKSSDSEEWFSEPEEWHS